MGLHASCRLEYLRNTRSMYVRQPIILNLFGWVLLILARILTNHFCKEQIEII